MSEFYGTGTQDHQGDEHPSSRSKYFDEDNGGAISWSCSENLQSTDFTLSQMRFIKELTGRLLSQQGNDSRCAYQSNS